MASTSRQSMSTTLPPMMPATLMPEILGFSPQLLLDDIINEANESITDTVNAVEFFLERWAEDRAKRVGGGWDGSLEIEQGMNTFQMMLESYTDVAFDVFEVWSLRNIFAINPGLHIVAPHHKGLDLENSPEEEAELMADIEDLRRRIDNQRRLKRMYARALRLAGLALRRSEQRVQRLDYLNNESDVGLLADLPTQVAELFESVSSLPYIDPTTSGSLGLAPTLVDPTKRPWETSKTAYQNWAVSELIQRAKEMRRLSRDEAAVSTVVGNIAERAYAIGDAESVRGAVEQLGKDTAMNKFKLQPEHELEQLELDTE